MTKKRGRPKTSLYETGFTIRMTKADLAKLRYDFDRYCVTLGQYTNRGSRRSMNDYLLQKLKG